MFARRRKVNKQKANATVQKTKIESFMYTDDDKVAIDFWFEQPVINFRSWEAWFALRNHLKENRHKRVSVEYLQAHWIKVIDRRLNDLCGTGIEEREQMGWNDLFPMESKMDILSRRLAKIKEFRMQEYGHCLLAEEEIEDPFDDDSGVEPSNVIVKPREVTERFNAFNFRNGPRRVLEGEDPLIIAKMNDKRRKGLHARRFDWTGIATEAEVLQQRRAESTTVGTEVVTIRPLNQTHNQEANKDTGISSTIHHSAVRCGSQKTRTIRHAVITKSHTTVLSENNELANIKGTLGSAHQLKRKSGDSLVVNLSKPIKQQKNESMEKAATSEPANTCNSIATTPSGPAITAESVEYPNDMPKQSPANLNDLCSSGCSQVSEVFRGLRFHVMKKPGDANDYAQSQIHERVIKIHGGEIIKDLNETTVDDIIVILTSDDSYNRSLFDGLSYNVYDSASISDLILKGSATGAVAKEDFDNYVFFPDTSDDDGGDGSETDEESCDDQSSVSVDVTKMTEEHEEGSQTRNREREQDQGGEACDTEGDADATMIVDETENDFLDIYPDNVSCREIEDENTTDATSNSMVKPAETFASNRTHQSTSIPNDPPREKSIQYVAYSKSPSKEHSSEGQPSVSTASELEVLQNKTNGSSCSDNKEGGVDDQERTTCDIEPMKRDVQNVLKLLRLDEMLSNFPVTRSKIDPSLLKVTIRGAAFTYALDHPNISPDEYTSIIWDHVKRTVMDNSLPLATVQTEIRKMATRNGLWTAYSALQHSYRLSMEMYLELCKIMSVKPKKSVQAQKS